MGTPPPHEQPGNAHDEKRHEDGTSHTQSQQPPAPPNPEDDASMVPPAKSPNTEAEDLSPERIDIFTLKPVSALKLLCHSIDLLVKMTGDVPPTPRVRTPTRACSPSRTPATQWSCGPKRDVMNLNLHVPGQEQSFAHDNIDGVPFRKTPIGSPESNPWDQDAHEDDIGHNAQPLYIQHATLARKFYSKRPPPISTEDYLLRMHKYCPMSTAAYLATSLYITRLAVTEKVMPVTPRNVHRLLLAGLRVAMKALEDLSWPHERFAKVGGVSEAELGRLEITFCFLTGFVLKVDSEELQKEAVSLAQVYQNCDFAVLDTPPEELSKKLELKLPENRFRHAVVSSSAGTGTRTPEKRKASSTLPSRPALRVDAGIMGVIEVMGQS